MAMPEILKGVEAYLEKSNLSSKDKILRALRRQIEQIPANARNHHGTELADIFHPAESCVSQEAEALFSLLKGYLSSASYRHLEAEKQFEVALSILGDR
jgi:hypothetical protein